MILKTKEYFRMFLILLVYDQGYGMAFVAIPISKTQIYLSALASLGILL